MATTKPAITTAPETQEQPKEGQRQGVRLAPPNIAIPDLGMSLAQARKEVEDAYADMKDCYSKEPDEAMRICAGHSARLGEIRMYSQRHEGNIRPLKQFRLNEVEPAMKDLEFQYNVASRLLTQRQLDWEMSKVGM